MAADQPSCSSSSKDSSNIGWMYEGAKSLVNREDYLLGKRIDKNFELYSDVVVKDRDEEGRADFFKKKLLQSGPERRQENQQKISALDVRVVRNEDPLVALKFQEEQRRRQMLENPLLKLKAQRVLRKEFEKVMNKAEKKKRKKQQNHKKSRDSSCSSFSSFSSSNSSFDTQKGKHKKSRRHEKRSAEGRRKNELVVDRGGSKNRKRGNSSGDNGKSEHRHHRRDDSCSDETKTRKKEEKRRGTPPQQQSSKNCQQKRSSKLTAEELEKRRREMLNNASWRDEVREKNFKMTEEQLRKEADDPAGIAPTFIKPMIDSATSNSSLEKRLQSNKVGIQRSHDHMEKSFLRK